MDNYHLSKGFYGDTLTLKNISLEHLKPHCEGGATTLNNLVLASREQNNKRGCKLLTEAIDKEKAVEYFKQFIGIKAKGFNGDDYIKRATKTIKNLGINLDIKG